MTPGTFVVYAVLIPVAAWLVASGLERYKAWLDRRPPAPPVDRRLLNAYSAAAFALLATLEWRSGSRYLSGIETAIAVFYAAQLLQLWLDSRTAPPGSSVPAADGPK